MPKIVVKEPAGAPSTFFFDKTTITIGRTSGNDIVINDPTISRLHVEIRHDGRGWFVRDCGSRNGIVLNKHRVKDEEPLVPGDEIILGWTVVVFGGPEPGKPREGANHQTDLPTWSASGSGVSDAEPVLVGQSDAIKEILSTIEKVAPTSTTVLISGESGTGKELVAQLIHHRSSRSKGPFVTVNCPAVPGSLLEAELFGVEKGVATGVDPRPGRFEAADGGTLFLDEIGDLDIRAQSKVLRFLEERKVERIGGRKLIPIDVRILAATNHDLPSEVARGTFRADLYHRLNLIALALPPLRDRPEDIPLLVKHFLARTKGPPVTLSEQAVAILAKYDFPGNVRELRHLIERVRLLAPGPVIRPEDLPPAMRRGGAHASGDSRTAADTQEIRAPDAELYERIVAALSAIMSETRRVAEFSVQSGAGR